MKDAHIICICRQIKIPDMGLDLVKGQVVVRDEAVALGSTDLKHAKSIGGVTVRYVQRSQETRAANTPNRVLINRTKPPMKAPALPTPPAPSAPPPPPIDETKMVARMVAELKPVIQKMITEAIDSKDWKSLFSDMIASKIEEGRRPRKVEKQETHD